jgi:hypothetical protein
MTVKYRALLALIIQDHAAYEFAKFLNKSELVAEIKDVQKQMAKVREMLESEIARPTPPNVVSITGKRKKRPKL